MSKRLSGWQAVGVSRQPKRASGRPVRHKRNSDLLPISERLEDRTMLSTMDFTNAAGGLWGLAANWTNVANPGDHHVPNANDDAVINVPGNVTVTYQGKQPTVQTMENYDTIWVQGSNAGGDAILTASQRITNNGTVLLQSINGTWRSDINTGSSTFANLGTITSGAGTGGERLFAGTLDNQATIDATSDYLDIEGVYKADAGTILGSGYIVNCTLQEIASPTSPSTVLISGTTTTLATDNLAGYTLWVQGSNHYGDTILKLASDETNYGAILLQSADGTWRSDINTNSHTLTNMGNVASSLGKGGERLIIGTTDNKATIDATGDYLDIQGVYKADGGTITGNGYIVNCTLLEIASPSSPSTMLISGTTTTLATDNLAGYTLWVQGSNHYGDTVLKLGGNVANRGNILLQSADGTWRSDINTGSSTLTNLGTITSSLGKGGERLIRGITDNQATIDATADYLDIQGVYKADSGTILGSGYIVNCTLYETAAPASPSTILVSGTTTTLATDNLAGYTLWVQGSNHYGDTILKLAANETNRGAILLQSADGTWRSDINTGSSTLTNLGTITSSLGKGGERLILGITDNQATIDATADYLDIQGVYKADGGTILGSGYIVNCTLYETAAPASPSTMLISGTTTTLATDNLAGYTLWVQGSNHYGDTILKLAANETNRGAILLQSADGTWRSDINTGSSTLTNLGTITSSLGKGGERLILGITDNQATIDATADYLDIQGVYKADGGTILGNGYIVNCTLYETAAPASPSTMLISGTTTTLATDNLAGYTLWVQGSNHYGDTILKLAANETNRGAILLQSAGGTWRSDINTGSSTLTNLGTITSSLGKGGERLIIGTTDNKATIDATGDYLDIQGVYKADAGTILGSGYIVNCTLQEIASPSSPSTILISGTTTTLATDNLAGYNLWVQGSNHYGDTILKLGGNVANRGNILLQSANGTWRSDINTGSSTLTNAGTITAGAGAGGERLIVGTTDNQATIDATADYLDIEGTYKADAGTILGSGYIVNCTLQEIASPTSPSTILVSGTGTTLATNNLAGYTLWVQGSNHYGDTILKLGTTSRITVRSSWSQSTAPGGSDLNAASFTFANAPEGTIEIDPGKGGERLMLVGAQTTLTGNLLTNPGAETGNLNGWTAGGSSNPRVDNGSFDSGIKPHSGNYDFLGGSGASGTLTQSIQLVGTQGITASAIDSGTLLAVVGFWEQGLNQGAPGGGADVTMTFRDASGNPLSTVSTPVVDSHNGGWQQFSGGFAIPAGTRSIDYTINFLRHFGSDLDAFVDDASLTVSSGAFLNAGTMRFATNTTLGVAGANLINSSLMSIAGTECNCRGFRVHEYSWWARQRLRRAQHVRHQLHQQRDPRPHAA